MTLGKDDIQRNDTQHTSMECHYAESRDPLNVMLSVVMLSVKAPFTERQGTFRKTPHKFGATTLSIMALCITTLNI
jgi:hypothetical protein